MDNYDEITDRIKELADNPKTLEAHISNNIEGIHESMPNVSQSIGNHIARSVGYLNSKIPQPAGVTPLMQKWEPSDIQKQAFERHYDAVNDPTKILHQIANGELSNESLEAVRTVHPQLAEEMQSKLRQEIKPEKAALLPNHIKRGLSMFLGMPLENIDLPAVKLSNQQVYAQNNAQRAAQMQGAGKTTQKGLSEITVAKRSATTTQKAEVAND